MALPPGNPDTFMREVDDAVRADRAQEFARRFGVPLIAAGLLGLAGLAGWLWWDNHGDASDGTRGAQLSTALETVGQGRPKAATAALEPLTKGDDPAYRALALMAQANIVASQGDLPGAAAKFAQVAADESVDQGLRDAALVRQMLASFDTTEPATVIARLRHLVATPGPAFASAAELSALAEMKRGNDAAASALFKRISETEGAAESLQRRSGWMAAMLAGAPSAAPSASAPAAARPTATPASAAPATKGRE